MISEPIASSHRPYYPRIKLNSVGYEGGTEKTQVSH